jgi:hypothetical protein
MGRFEKVMSDLAALPDDRRDALVDLLEQVLHAQAGAQTLLSADQLAELDRRLAEPAVYADDADVEAFFARHAG